MNNQTQSRSANGYTAKGTGVLVAVLVCVLFSLGAMPVQAFDCVLDEDGDGIGDGTSGASSSTNLSRLACGNNASAAESSSTALGRSASAAGISSTALGAFVSAAGGNSTALGRSTSAAGISSTALGRSASVAGTGSTAVGEDAEVDDMSTNAVALGHDAKVVNASGGIAIGADLNNDGTGATATAEGAIAIGADVVAAKANTMTVGVPIEVKRDDGTTQVLVNEKSAGNAVRTLFNVVCDTCTPGFRFNQLLPSNNTWNFRMLQSGNFSVDDPATVGKEAEFRSGGDLKIAGTLIQSSSRALKTDIRQIEAEEVLTRLEQLPISEWSYKKDNGRVKHIGPMAEDFHALFNVGVDNKSISSLDTSGVALAAIKSLHQENKQLKADTDQALTTKDKQIADLQHQIDELKEILASMAVLNQSTSIADNLSN